MSIDQITIKQLRVLQATARLRSVTRAAESLYVTPPAVSAQLKKLEKKVGTTLLERTSEGFELTPAGTQVIDLAESITALMDRTGDRLRALREGAEGYAVLGVVSTGKYFAPGIVARFQHLHPGIRVALAVGNRAEILRGIDRREYDLLIMGRPPAHLPFQLDVLGDHPFVLIARPDHPLAGEGDIPHAALQDQVFLTREEGSGTRLLTSRFLDHISDERTLQVMEMGTNETIKQAVLAGLGIALISRHTCHAELAEGRLVSLDVVGLPLVRQWYLIAPEDRELTRAAESLQGFILAHRGELLPD